MNKLVLAAIFVLLVASFSMAPYTARADDGKFTKDESRVSSADDTRKVWIEADRGKELRIKPDNAKPASKASRAARSVDAVRKSDETAERVTRSMSAIENNKIALGVDVNELRLTSSDYDEPSYPEHAKGVSYVFYEQTHQGIPVFGSYVGLVSINGEDVVLSSNTYAGIDIPTTPALTAADAARRAKQNTQIEKDPKNYSLIIFPVNSSTEDYRLAWKIEFPLVFDPPRAWVVIVDAHTGEIIGKENKILYSYVYGNVTGLVYMDNPTVAPVMVNFSNLNVTAWQNGAMVNSTPTGSDGAYNLTGLSGDVLIIANLRGPYADVINADQARANHSTDVSVPAVHNWNWSVNDTSYNLEESSVFYHMNRIHDFVTKGDPFDITAMNYPVQGIVEYSRSACNAFTDLTDLYFYGPGDGCDSTALGSDIVYHEYGHIITDRVMGLSSYSAGQNGGSMHEGFADYFAATLRNDSVIGYGVFPDPIRYLNNTLRMPYDFEYEVHDDSMILSGALWNLRGLLGNSSADNLTIRAMKLRGTTFTQFLADTLTIDDNNANLADDTPHTKEICNSFYRDHGIFNNNCLNITLVFAPLNTSYTSRIAANVTYRGTSWCGYSLDGAANVTLTNSSPSWHANIAVAHGGHDIKFYCNDTSNAYVSSDPIYFNVRRNPVFSNNMTFPATPARIASGNASFQIRWTNPDNETDAISAVIFRLNGTNYTSSSPTPVQNNSDGVFWINATLATNSANEYQWYANDTENLWTSTQPAIFRALKAFRGNTYLFENSTPMMINDYPAPGNSSSIVVPNNVNGTISNILVFVGINHTYIGDLRIKLQSPGGKVITLHHHTGGGIDGLFTWYDNQTSTATLLGLTQFWDDAANGTWMLNVTDLVGVDTGNITKWKLLLVIDEGAFPQWSSNNSYLQRTYEPNGVYSFQAMWNDPDGGPASVSRAVFQLNSTNYTNFSSPALQNNSQGVFWINFTDLSAGTYYFRWYANNTANSWNATPMSGFTVYKQPTKITLLLNGTAGDVVYNVPAIANFTAYLNVTGKNITLTSNMNGWLDQNSATSLYNITLLQQMGIFKMTAYFSGDGNYSSSLLSLAATVADTQPPRILSNGTSHDSGIRYGPGRTYTFNLTAQDNIGISNAILQFNSANHTASMYAGSASAGSWSVNITDLSANATGYPTVWYVNDTSNNWNKTAEINYAINKNISAYTTIRLNKTPSEGTDTFDFEVGEPFHVHVSASDQAIKFNIYENLSSADTPEFAFSQNGVIESDAHVTFAGGYHFWVNSSENENYTSNGTLSHILVRAKDTMIPKITDSIMAPRSVRINSNITFMAVSEDYGYINASVNIYNKTSPGVMRMYMDQMAWSGYKITHAITVNSSMLDAGTFAVNLSLTDPGGNSVNHSMGNITVSDSTGTNYYGNTRLPIEGNIGLDLSSELNISFNISSRASGSADSLVVSSYNINPSNDNTNGVAINKFSEISAGGFLSDALNWVQMKFFYSSSDVPTGYDENNLRIYYNHPNGTWVPYDGSGVGGVNTTEKYVWSNSTHFSLYGIFVMPTCSDGIQNQGETGADCGGPCSACASNPSRPAINSGGGGGYAASKTTTTATTSTTTTTITITTTTITTTTTTTTLTANASATAQNNSVTGGFLYADKKIRPQLLVFVSLATIVILAVGATYKNRKNIKRMIKNLGRNLGLD